MFRWALCWRPFAFPILLLLPWFRPEHSYNLLLGFGVLVAILVVFTHRKNIGRLLAGNESKANISFGKKIRLLSLVKLQQKRGVPEFGYPYLIYTFIGLLITRYCQFLPL